MKRLTTNSLKDFCHVVASESVTPGGGSVSAMSAAMAASLAKMVLQVTIGKAKYSQFDTENSESVKTLGPLIDELLEAIERDANNFNWVTEALAMPKSSELERLKRKNALSEASKKANEAPIFVCEKAIQLLRLFKDSLGKINSNAITDWAVGAQQAYSALEGAAMNVKINSKMITDSKYENSVCTSLRVHLGEGRNLISVILNQVHSCLDESN